MLTGDKQNIHHHKLPQAGEIGLLRGLEAQGLSNRKCIVESFPLCDNVLPYSKGIHTCTVKFMDNGTRARVSGFYFQAVR